MTLATIVHAADAAHNPAEPFKVANIHFETNPSALQYGIQIIFDMEGITKGLVKDPDGRRITSSSPHVQRGQDREKPNHAALAFA